MEVKLNLFNADELLVRIEASRNETLAQAIWLSGKIAPLPLCAGLGLCGLCKIRFKGQAPAPVARDIKYFTEDELHEGWRLACAHKAPDFDLDLELPRRDFDKIPYGIPRTAGHSVCLGLDLGTTSIQWQAIDQNEAVVSQGNLLNPQAGAGADIISRLEFASRPEGAKKLAALLNDAIENILNSLIKAGLQPLRVCVAANSAITGLLLQKNLTGLRSAPYFLDYRGGEILDFHDIPLLIPPLVSPFIGGDISAGLLYLRDRKRPFLLADLGTNAELALVSDKIYLASVPLGPALEGIGPECGHLAGPGIASAFQLSAKGLLARSAASPQFVSPDTMRGISGTGYISLIALLLNLNIISDDGHFNPPNIPAMPLSQKLAQNVEAGRLHLAKNIFLSLKDIELLLKVKAAFQVAFSQLLQMAAMDSDKLAAIYLGGALGAHVDFQDLVSCGFLPRHLLSKIRAEGNTSLKGACLLALKPEYLASLHNLLKNKIVIDLAADAQFYRNYIKAMRWSYNA